MKLASILVAAVGVAVAGFALHAHFGPREPEGEVVRLPAARPAEAAVVRTPASEPKATEPNRVTSVPNDRASLARALQKELHRVGCYSGEINGAWTGSSRAAMKTFTERVNASLPVDAPDYILLALVQRHEGKACGAGCPSGQSMGDEGRCVPSAVLAKAVPTPRPVVPAEPRAQEKVAVTTPSFTPSAALAPEMRSPPIRGNAAIAPREDVAGTEVRASESKTSARPIGNEAAEERARVAAANSQADREADVREERSRKRITEADDDDRPKRKVRKVKYRQPKYVRKFLRSMNKTFAGNW